MNKHTPGPWLYANAGDIDAAILESDGTTVARLTVTENTTAHSHLEANARLIAAAPTLLVELQRLADRVEQITLADGSTPDTLGARAAIARAQGEPFMAEPEQAP